MATRTTDRILELIARQHRGPQACAQICVIQHDEVVLERALGCSPDALFLIYSASKPFVALLIHLLAERGQLRLDEPVAAHWPEFGQHGKGAITIRHVLQHRAGIPMPGGLFATVLHMHDWNCASRRDQ
jgi:CubicO group peptidase (beta-lactamase class C family)